VRVRYSAARLVWLLECVAALREARAHQAARQGKTTALGATRAAAMEKAKQLRADLIDALERLAGDDDAQTAAIARDAGDHRTTEAPDTLADALDALAGRVEDWCAKNDERSRTLAASVDLLPGDAAVARATAIALRTAATGKTLEGRTVAHDTPPVNRIEGRVLFEMKEAMQAFAAANEKNTDVPKLVPGAGTRQVLASRNTGKAAPPAAKPPAPTDAASTTPHA